MKTRLPKNINEKVKTKNTNQNKPNNQISKPPQIARYNKKPKPIKNQNTKIYEPQNNTTKQTINPKDKPHLYEEKIIVTPQ